MSPLEPLPDSIPETETLSPRSASAASLLRLRHHVTYLVIALGILLFGALLSIDDQNQVVVPGIEIPLPGVCMSRQWFSISCPGCGLTRGCIALMHGQWRQAWTYNPGIFLVVLLIAIQVPYRVIQLGRILHGVSELQYSGFFEKLLMGTVLLLFVQWVIRMWT